MKSTLIALAAAGMLASTVAIAQQPYHRDSPQRWAQNDRWDDREAGINERQSRINARIQRGMKVAFSTAIVEMLKRALWIVGLAVAVVLFIPEVPLRSRAAPAAAAAAD